jgi:hypothetical protein
MRLSCDHPSSAASEGVGPTSCRVFSPWSEHLGPRAICAVWLRMGQEARRIVQERFDAPREISMYESYYAEAMD